MGVNMLCFISACLPHCISVSVLQVLVIEKISVEQNQELSWSVIEFGGLMKGELQNAREALRWATDYLLKATAHPNTIYVQVGDATKDHACWERPEDMDTPRTVIKIDQNTPGTEVAAETAAALAAASLVFRKCDPNYSRVLARRTIKVFEFADKHRGTYSTGLRCLCC